MSTSSPPVFAACVSRACRRPARDELGVSSDVDVLVEFAGPATFGAYMDLKFYLEDLLGRPVDLVTDKALRNELRPYVEKEMIRVA